MQKRSRILTGDTPTGRLHLGHVKAEIATAIDDLLGPMRERRAALEGDRGDARVLEVLRAHTVKANALAEETLSMAKQAMKLDFGRRSLLFP